MKFPICNKLKFSRALKCCSKLQEKSSKTMEIVFGLLTSNGKFNGGIGNIESSTTDIVCVGYFIKDYGTRDIEFQFPFIRIGCV